VYGWGSAAAHQPTRLVWARRPSAGQTPRDKVTRAGQARLRVSPGIPATRVPLPQPALSQLHACFEKRPLNPGKPLICSVAPWAWLVWLVARGVAAGRDSKQQKHRQRVLSSSGSGCCWRAPTLSTGMTQQCG
jgi:hypothetical protein